MHLTSKLEKKCNKFGHTVDILSLNGSLKKHDKLWRIRSFCDPSTLSRKFKFNCLVSTNCTNIGIDNHLVHNIFCFEIPYDMPAFFQKILVNADADVD